MNELVLIRTNQRLRASFNLSVAVDLQGVIVSLFPVIFVVKAKLDS